MTGEQRLFSSHRYIKWMAEKLIFFRRALLLASGLLALIFAFLLFLSLSALLLSIPLPTSEPALQAVTRMIGTLTVGVYVLFSIGTNLSRLGGLAATDLANPEKHKPLVRALNLRIPRLITQAMLFLGIGSMATLHVMVEVVLPTLKASLEQTSREKAEVVFMSDRAHLGGQIARQRENIEYLREKLTAVQISAMRFRPDHDPNLIYHFKSGKAGNNDMVRLNFEPRYQGILDSKYAESLASTKKRINDGKELMTIDQVDVVGYADATGDPAKNQQLSLARALTVRSLLVAAGLPENIISVRAGGPSQEVCRPHHNHRDSCAMEARRAEVYFRGKPRVREFPNSWTIPPRQWRP